MSSVKWKLMMAKRPINTMVTILHGVEAVGSFVIQNDDPQSIGLWEHVQELLEDRQKDDEPNTRIN